MTDAMGSRMNASSCYHPPLASLVMWKVLSAQTSQGHERMCDLHFHSLSWAGESCFSHSLLSLLILRSNLLERPLRCRFLSRFCPLKVSIIIPHWGAGGILLCQNPLGLQETVSPSRHVRRQSDSPPVLHTPEACMPLFLIWDVMKMEWFSHLIPLPRVRPGLGLWCLTHFTFCSACQASASGSQVPVDFENALLSLELGWLQVK